MLHELLFALSGYPGSVFVQDGSHIKVVGEFPFLSPSETAVLNRLCVLAAHFKRFQSFIDMYRNGTSSWDSENERDGRLEDGLYLSSFCTGLDSVLSAYRKCILQLEEEVLNDPTLTICHFQYKLEKFHPLFHALAAIIDKLETKRYHGCQILHLLHGHWMCGQPATKEAVQSILHSCHCVMYHQLITWLLHGMLLDHHGEFFIHQTKEALTPTQDDDLEEDLGAGGVTGKQMRRSLDINGLSNHDQVHFTINATMLPSYIPLRIAEKILFAGESVQMFESKKQVSAARYSDPVLGDNEGKFVKKLSHLRQQPVFIVQHFEEVIDEIRTCVAQHLWRLVVEEHNLIAELQTFKDFFLLGRGELFLAFIDQAQSLLTVLPHTGMEHYANICFQQAAHKVLFDDDEVLSRFHLTTPLKERQGPSQRRLPSNSAKSSGESGWHVLGMTCTVQWPIHILFTPSVLERYNRLFQFLLGLKRVQLELHQCWLHQMQRKHHKPSVSETAIWQLRSHMAFLLDNLQYYLQVDVLDAQFSQLQSKILSTRDFEAVRVAHDQFLSSLMAQCFLLTKPVHHCLVQMIDLCHSFSMLILKTAEFTSREYTHVDKIAQDFNHQSSFLFKILSGVKANQSSPHLTQLLLRLDFNKFYSNAEGAMARIAAAP